MHYKDPFSISAKDLAEREKQLLSSLNDQLKNIEAKIKETSIGINSDMKRTIANSNGWLSDYEIECIVTFYLRSDDPAYVQDKDNILVELTEPLKTKAWDWGIADGNNHNEFHHMNHPMRNEIHCWLYHCLYDHTELGWANILRIGNIWVDIQSTYQHLEDMDSQDCRLTKR